MAQKDVDLDLATAKILNVCLGERFRIPGTWELANVCM